MMQHASSDWLSTLLVFHRGEDDSSLVALAFGLNTSKDLIMNNSANTAPVAAEPDRISTWAARMALWVRSRSGNATNIEASQIPCTQGSQSEDQPEKPKNL